MKTVDRGDFPPDRIRRLVSGVPFFNEVLRQDAGQFDVLLHCCDMLAAGSGDVVIRQGDEDHGLYFLLRGQLAVVAEAPVAGRPTRVLNHISPGEVFGALSMLRGTPRSATLCVDEATREAVLARIDFMYFSNISDFSVFSLPTKLSFYHMVVHNIRWTLEVNRMHDPHHEVVSQLRKVPVFNGTRGTREELAALYEQAHVLADLLCRWNESAGETPAVAVPGLV